LLRPAHVAIKILASPIERYARFRHDHDPNKRRDGGLVVESAPDINMRPTVAQFEAKEKWRRSQFPLGSGGSEQGPHAPKSRQRRLAAFTLAVMAGLDPAIHRCSKVVNRRRTMRATFSHKGKRQ
jgi:hypothetical protein